MKLDNGKYRVWAYRRDGTKFLARFKNEAEAKRWGKVTNTPLKKANVSKVKRKVRRTNDAFGFNLWRM